MLKLKRKPNHPGEILNEEFLKPLEISQSLLAEAIGVSFRSINELVNEKRNLSLEMAIKLSKYFGLHRSYGLICKLSTMFIMFQNISVKN